MLPSLVSTHLCPLMTSVVGQLVWFGDISSIALNVACPQRAAYGYKHYPWVRQGEREGRGTRQETWEIKRVMGTG